MLKSFFHILKRIIFAVLFIYAYNRISAPINIYIPFNVITISFVSFFGMPSILMFVLYAVIFI